MTAVHDLLRFDPLASAENLTGLSYQEDEATMALGFLMHADHSKRKEAVLQQADDSWLNMNLEDTLALYERLGFEEVLCDEFLGRSYSGEPAPTETFRILWHPKGILATVESYMSDRRNNTKIYYNVRIHDKSDRSWWDRTSSGHLHKSKDVYVGDHDAREGVRNAIERWEEVGEFLPVWVEPPFLWLLTYTDSDVEGYDYEAINASRIQRLPQHVQDAIRGEEVRNA
jgi:hypothetical protein